MKYSRLTMLLMNNWNGKAVLVVGGNKKILLFLACAGPRTGFSDDL